jgi:hypothetical protein
MLFWYRAIKKKIEARTLEKGALCRLSKR